MALIAPETETDAARNAGWKRFAGALIILVAAAIATAPQLFRGNTCGHDFDIHLVSWFDCLSSWRHGIVYPQWTESANYGAGEPRFVFYPPFTWMLGGALGSFLPWRLVPIALTFLLLAATGLATRALARMNLADGAATLAGCAALFSGYALFTAYERSAFGEMAGFWIPLLLLLMLRKGGREGRSEVGREVGAFGAAFDGSATWLAVVIAGAWLSNAPLGVMASYLLAAVALLLAAMRRSWAPLLRATAGVTLGLGLAAFYLLPAAYEQRWVDIHQATNDPGLMIENSFLFGHAAAPEMDLHNAELTRVSWIAVAMIAVALLSFVVAWRRGRLREGRGWWLPLAVIPAAVLLLLLPFSLPVWNLLPKLRFLQFPWRWLVVVEAPMAVVFAAAIWPRATARRSTRLLISALCATLFLGSTAVAAFYFFQPCDDEDAVAPMVQVDRSGAGFEGVYEYEPIGADNGLVATGLPGGCLVSDPHATLGIVDTQGANPDWWVEQHSCDATFSYDRPTNPEHLRLTATAPHGGVILLRLRTYPAWRITVNGQAASLISRDDGLTAVAVQQGRVQIDADWTETPDVRTGRWLTAIALILAVALWYAEHRTRPANRAQLS